MKAKLAVVLGSLVVGLLVVVGAVLMGGDDRGEAEPPPEDEIVLTPVTVAQLEAGDGKDGRPCLVAVDGTVYLIEDFTLWQDGEHTTSEGQAYCGADMSEVIRQAPHGTDKLELLDEVGPLTE